MTAAAVFPMQDASGTRPNDSHVPVMLDEAMAALAPTAGGVFVDATFGRGGHARALLSAAPANSHLLAIDKDPDAMPSALALAEDDSRLEFVAASFSELGDILKTRALIGGVDGVLFDLGVSSPQLASSERGFSFTHPGPLDMRMNPAIGEPLSAWLDRVDSRTLAGVIRRYGDESQARRIAEAILASRAAGELTDSGRLAAVIADAVPAAVARRRATHPATKTFNALRVFINDELGALATGLEVAVRALAPGGRLVVISFQSAEDRLVKRALRHQAQPPQPPLPMVDEIPPALELIGRPVTPGGVELEANPRARSAIMRIARRTHQPVIEP